MNTASLRKVLRSPTVLSMDTRKDNAPLSATGGLLMPLYMDNRQVDALVLEVDSTSQRNVLSRCRRMQADLSNQDHVFPVINLLARTLAVRSSEKIGVNVSHHLEVVLRVI